MHSNNSGTGAKANSSAVRLQRFLSQAGVASRRRAEELILDGQIEVNGRIVRELGTKVVPGKDRVRYQGRLLQIESLHTYLFHKPRRVLSTMTDPRQRPCIGDYVRKLPVKVFPVGRLDFDVNGLIILSNDGDYAEQLLHPRYGQQRTYWAIVTGKPTASDFQKLKSGVELEDGPAKLVGIRYLGPFDKPLAEQLLGIANKEQSILIIEAEEGRNHFIKRIMAKVGFDVKSLCRVGFGRHQLGKLKPGAIKEVINTRQPPAKHQRQR